VWLVGSEFNVGFSGGGGKIMMECDFRGKERMMQRKM